MIHERFAINIDARSVHAVLFENAVSAHDVRKIMRNRAAAFAIRKLCYRPPASWKHELLCSRIASS